MHTPNSKGLVFPLFSFSRIGSPTITFKPSLSPPPWHDRVSLGATVTVRELLLYIYAFLIPALTFKLNMMCKDWQMMKTTSLKKLPFTKVAQRSVVFVPSRQSFVPPLPAKRYFSRLDSRSSTIRHYWRVVGCVCSSGHTNRCDLPRHSPWQTRYASIYIFVLLCLSK